MASARKSTPPSGGRETKQDSAEQLASSLCLIDHGNRFDHAEQLAHVFPSGMRRIHGSREKADVRSAH
jgi:hypothetical protein